ncbi:FIGNL1-interacting regulator of recombination and mitosis-like [Dysidea avara]|uniref:FIGNL1-interacting regulator of recombination and mitosis-like n=1 Tax=Dysidea avara TaxID=196820 RepID=UPI00331ED6F0
MEMSFSAKQFLVGDDLDNSYSAATKQLNNFISNNRELDADKKLDTLLGLLKEVFHEFTTDKTVISTLFVAFARVSTVVQDVANRCRHLLSSKSQSDDLATNLTNLLQLQQVGVTTLGDLIGCLLLPDNAEYLSTVTSSVIHTTTCEALSAVHLIFSLCHEIEKSQLLSSPPTTLGNLLKATFNFVKVVSGLLDVMDLTNDDGCVSKVIHHMHLVGKVTLSCEAAITVATWRVMMKLLCRSKPHLPDDWSIQPIMFDLCEAVKAKLAMCLRIGVQLQTSNNEANQDAMVQFGRHVKMCRFVLTVIMKLSQEFGSLLHQCVADLYSVLLNMLSSIPPSLNGAPLDNAGPILQEINSSITSVVQPLLTILCACRQFVCLVVSGEGLSDQHWYGWCVCLLRIAELFPTLTEDLKELCMSNRQDDPSSCLLLDAIFDVVPKCYVELSYPVWLVPMTSNGQQPNRTVSLYDHIITRLTGLVLTQPPVTFHQIELILLNYLFSDDLYCSLVAADVWALVAQKEPVELCLHHVSVLTGLLMDLPLCCSFVISNLSSLISNMLSYLPLELQEQFVHHHSPGEVDNLKLWSRIGVICITTDLRTQVHSVLITVCSDVINKNIRESEVNVMTMHWAVCCLTRLVTISSSGQNSSLSNVILNLWTFTANIDPAAASQSHLLQLFVCDVIHLISTSLSILSVYDIVQVMDQVSTLVSSTGQCHAVLISATRILAQCGTVVVPDTMKNKFIQSVVSMCHQLLSHTHWMVHHYAAEAFRSFAEVTCYVDVVEQCIPSDLSIIIVDFLNKVPFKASTDASLLTKNALCSRLRARWSSVTELRQVVAAKMEEEKCLQEKKHSLECYNRGLMMLRQGLQELQNQQLSLPTDVVDQLTLFNQDLYAYLTVHSTEPT